MLRRAARGLTHTVRVYILATFPGYTPPDPAAMASTVKLALKAHTPGGHTRAVGAIFQGTRQGTPPVCPDWNSNMILTGQALKAHQGTLCI